MTGTLPSKRARLSRMVCSYCGSLALQIGGSSSYRSSANGKSYRAGGHFVYRLPTRETAAGERTSIYSSNSNKKQARRHTRKGHIIIRIGLLYPIIVYTCSNGAGRCRQAKADETTCAPTKQLSQPVVSYCADICTIRCTQEWMECV